MNNTNNILKSEKNYICTSICLDKDIYNLLRKLQVQNYRTMSAEINIILKNYFINKNQF